MRQQIWIWVNSGSWWWTGRPGMLQSMGSQRVGHNWATELNWYMCFVAQSCPTLCNPMNRSTSGLPVHQQLPEFTQIYVHWVGNAIQPSHPLLSPLLPIPPSIRVFSNESTLHMTWPKYWSFSLSISPWRPDLLLDGLVGFPHSPRDSQESSPAPQFKSINSSAFSFLHSPTLTSIHDHWKNHSLD